MNATKFVTKSSRMRFVANLVQDERGEGDEMGRERGGVLKGTPPVLFFLNSLTRDKYILNKNIEYFDGSR